MNDKSCDILEIKKDHIQNFDTLPQSKIIHVSTEHIRTENKDLDSTDGVLHTIHDISDSAQ